MDCLGQFEDCRWDVRSVGLSGGIGQCWNEEIANEAAEVERVASAVFEAMTAA